MPPFAVSAQMLTGQAKATRGSWVGNRWVRRLALGIGLTVPVLFFLRHLLVHPTYIGSFGDIRCFHFWWAVSRKSLLEFGQLPFWNPYYCGGMVHWANVQTMFLAPTFLANLIAGPGIGLRLHIVMHFFAGSCGCYALARRQGIGGLWSIAPGVVFVFGANFAERATGHIGFMPLLLLPWVTYFYDRARIDFRWAIPCGAVIAYAVIAGGPYPFVMFCVYVGILVGYDLAIGIVAHVRQHRARRADPSLLWEDATPWSAHLLPIAIGATIALTAGLLAAVKLLPVIDFLSEYPRTQHEHDYLAAWQVWEVFLEADLVRHRKGYFYVFGEYRNYLGPIAMLALPVMLMRARRHARDYFLVFVAGALMLGDLGSWAPYTLLSKLPVLGSLRVPVRYAILVDLHIGLLFGHMLATAAAAVRRLAAEHNRWRRAGTLGLVAVLLGCAGDLMTNNNRQHENFFNTPPSPPTRTGPFRMIPGSPQDYPFAPPRNEGHIRCYDPNPLKVSPNLRAFADTEVYVANGSGNVTLHEWTPNRLELDVDVPASRIVAVNMNYHRDWRADGGKVRPWRGLLAVEVPAGKSRVTLRYRPRRLGLYLALTVIGWLAGIWGWRRLGRRQRQQAAA